MDTVEKHNNWIYRVADPSILEVVVANPWLHTGTTLSNRVTVILSNHFLEANHDSSVGIGTRLRAGHLRNRGSITGRGKRFVSSPQRPDRLWVLYMGTRGSFPGGKAAGPWSWPTYSAEVKNVGVIPPLPYTMSWKHHLFTRSWHWVHGSAFVCQESVCCCNGC
jgi:hypothetical protein